MLIISDFDGTITNKDTNDIIISTYHGSETLNNFEKDVLNNTIHNNDFYYYFNNIDIDIEKFYDILKKNNIEIDYYFNNFYDNLKERDKFFIMSSGFIEIIKKYIINIPDNNIISNSLNNIDYKFSKINYIKELKNRFLLNEPILYIGDGLSDIEVIPHVDILFSKNGSVLHKYCINNNIYTYIFNDFNDIDIKINKQNIHYKLLSPGVVRSNYETYKSLGFQHYYMHRHDEFHILYKELNNRLIRLVSNYENKYTTMFTTGSGTSAMDEVINSLIKTKKILYLSNGMFGERWINISKYYNIENSICMIKEWGKPFNNNEILEFLKNNEIDCIVMVHCDTSTGILNDIDSICNLVKNYNKNIITIVDTVSTFGAIPINIDNKIDILVTNPNKALESFMGISIIIINNDIMQTINETDPYSYSLNLKKHYNNSLNFEVCNSISISSLNALNTSLKLNFDSKYNIEIHYKDYIRLYNKLYNEIEYPKLLEYGNSSPCIITILINDSSEIIKYLKHNLFIVYECKGSLLNKGFQISLFGADRNINNITKLIELIKDYGKLCLK